MTLQLGVLLVVSCTFGRVASFVRSSPSSLGPGSGDWTVESPEQHGLAYMAVEEMSDYIMNDLKAAIRECVVIVKDGVIVHEVYRDPLYNNSAHEGMSMTKTLGALLMGWASTHGLLDIDADITAKYGVPSPRPYPVTTRQIMSQAIAGEHGPGEGWAYDADGARWLDTLPQVLARASGFKPSQIWKEQFVEQLGLSKHFAWPDVDEDWAAGSRGTCRDYARLGQLLLNNGWWRGIFGDSLVSSSYVSQMHTPQTRYAPYEEYSNPCYGLLTWLNTNPGTYTGSKKYPGICRMWPKRTQLPAGSPSDVYLAAGLLGQETMVIPSHNMVVVTMGTTADDYPVQRIMYEAVCKIYPGDCLDVVKDHTEHLV